MVDLIKDVENVVDFLTHTTSGVVITRFAWKNYNGIKRSNSIDERTTFSVQGTNWKL